MRAPLSLLLSSGLRRGSEGPVVDFEGGDEVLCHMRRAPGPQSDGEHLVSFPEIAITERLGEVAADDAKRLHPANNERACSSDSERRSGVHQQPPAAINHYEEHAPGDRCAGYGHLRTHERGEHAPEGARDEHGQAV